MIQLLIPIRLIAFYDPLRDPTEFVRRPALDCRLDVLDPFHNWSLTQKVLEQILSSTRGLSLARHGADGAGGDTPIDE